jgi:transcriptional regulator with XRE-family HTH domain
MSDETSFGRWLQRRRKALDLTQGELARRVGCAVETLRKIEADARRPSRQIAERLADALELPKAEDAAFVRAARGELTVDRLAPPRQSVSEGALGAAVALPRGTITFLLRILKAARTSGSGIQWRCASASRTMMPCCTR